MDDREDASPKTAPASWKAEQKAWKWDRYLNSANDDWPLWNSIKNRRGPSGVNRAVGQVLNNAIYNKTGPCA
jgi:hypothetical protein